MHHTHQSSLLDGHLDTPVAYIVILFAATVSFEDGTGHAATVVGHHYGMVASWWHSAAVLQSRLPRHG